MILPTNGKVVVFDDKYEEVKELLKALSKQKIPYLYYQAEDGEDLPDSPVENIRLVFLDLELVVDSRATEQNIISPIYARLSKVLEPNSNYILVYWSTKEDKYGDAIKDSFNNGLKDYKPIISLSLDKIATKKVENPIQFIIDNIKENADDFKVLKVFSFWENLVNNSSGNLINNLVNFIEKDNNWDDVTKYLLFKLATAYGGKEISSSSELEQIKNSFYTLNHTFIDTLENSISKSLNGQEKEFTSVLSSNGNDKFASLINKKLLLSEDLFYGDTPGVLLFIDKEIEEEEKTIQQELEKTIQNDRIPKEHRQSAIVNAENKAKEKQSKISSKKVALNKNYNSIVNSLLDETNRENLKEIIENSIKIELNISPICDFAQQKMPCCRILPGLLINKKYSILKGNAYNYISDATVNLNNEDYLIIFDFKYLYSIPSNIARKRKTNYKLRQQLLADIQVKLGSHINRAGVLYL